MDIDNFSLDTEFKRVYLRFDNLFNGDKILGKN